MFTQHIDTAFGIYLGSCNRLGLFLSIQILDFSRRRSSWHHTLTYGHDPGKACKSSIASIAISRTNTPELQRRFSPGTRVPENSIRDKDRLRAQIGTANDVTEGYGLSAPLQW